MKRHLPAVSFKGEHPNAFGAISLAAMVLLSCTGIQQPELISPANGEALLTAMPEFIWHPVSNARFYLIEISQGSDFAQFIDTLIFGDSSFILGDTLELGKTYYWRITAHNAQEGESDPSEVESFRVKEGVELLLPAVSDSAADSMFEWKGFSGATSYNFHISRYADFAELYFDTTLATTSFSVPDSLPPATYYWRVRAFASEGPVSSWSVVRRVVSYRLADTYFPLYLGRNQIYEWIHIEGDSNFFTGEMDTSVLSVTESTFTVTDTFWEKGRLYWVISDPLWDAGDTFSITHDSIFSPIYFLGDLYPPDDTSYRFYTWEDLLFRVVYGPEGMTFSWHTGDRGASGYDSVGILRVPGEGIVRMVHFTSDIPGDSAYSWEVDSLELE